MAICPLIDLSGASCNMDHLTDYRKLTLNIFPALELPLNYILLITFNKLSLLSTNSISFTRRICSTYTDQIIGHYSPQLTNIQQGTHFPFTYYWPLTGKKYWKYLATLFLHVVCAVMTLCVM